jgi:hypothetical protein
VVVVGNTVIGANRGIMIRTDDLAMEPRGIVVSGNTLSGCTSRDIFVAQCTDLALGPNTHRNSSQKYDIDASTTTFAGEAYISRLVAQGASARVSVVNATGDEVWKAEPSGRTTQAEDIYFTGSGGRGLRHDGTGQLNLESVANNVDIRAGGAAALLITTSELRMAVMPQWNVAGIEQTGVGAAGGASALPATPTKYLKVKDSTGAILVVPAYAT